MGFFGAEYKYLRERGYSLYLNGYYGRFYSSLLARLKIDYYTRIPFSIQAIASYNRFDFYRSSTETFYEDYRPPYVIQDESYAKFEAAIPLQHNAKAMLGVSLADNTDEYYQTIHFLKADTTDQTDFKFYSPYFTYDANTLNYPMFPTMGYQTLFQTCYVNGFEKFIPGSTSTGNNIIKNNRSWAQIHFKYEHYFKLNHFLNVNYYFEGNYSNQSFLNNYLSTVIASPAFNPTPHLQTLFVENFRNPIYLAAGIKTIFFFLNKFHLRIEGYVFQPYKRIENTIEGNPQWSKPYIYRYGMVSSSLVYQTPFGPVSLTGCYYEKSDQKFYIIFNIGYLIFNKKALN